MAEITSDKAVDMALFTGEGRLILNGRNQQISDCEFSGAGIHADGASARIERCLIECGFGAGVLDSGANTLIQGNEFTGNYDGIWLRGSTGSQIIGNTFYSVADAISILDAFTAGSIISDNYAAIGGNFINGNGNTDNDEYVVAGNVAYGAGGLVGMYAEQIVVANNHLFVDGKGIELIATSAGYSVIVTGNNIDGGNIYIEGADFDILYGGVIIADNAVIPLSTTHGIHLKDCIRVSVHHNHVSSEFDDEDDTHDGIFVEGDSGSNHIEANYVRGNNVLRYGINISAATCVGNIVVGNVLGAAADYETGPYNDAGTGTINQYPAHATYGDNFVS